MDWQLLPLQRESIIVYITWDWPCSLCQDATILTQNDRWFTFLGYWKKHLKTEWFWWCRSDLTILTSQPFPKKTNAHSTPITTPINHFTVSFRHEEKPRTINHKLRSFLHLNFFEAFCGQIPSLLFYHHFWVTNVPWMVTTKKSGGVYSSLGSILNWWIFILHDILMNVQVSSSCLTWSQPNFGWVVHMDKFVPSTKSSPNGQKVAGIQIGQKKRIVFQLPTMAFRENTLLNFRGCTTVGSFFEQKHVGKKHDPPQNKKNPSKNPSPGNSWISNIYFDIFDDKTPGPSSLTSSLVANQLSIWSLEIPMVPEVETPKVRGNFSEIGKVPLEDTP